MKHVSWVYKGFGLILRICSPGNAGSVARAITAACDDVVFGAHAQKKAAAQLAVQEHATSECDIFWKKVVTADKSRGSHFEHTYAVMPDGKPFVLTAFDGGLNQLNRLGIEISTLLQ